MSSDRAESDAPTIPEEYLWWYEAVEDGVLPEPDSDIKPGRYRLPIPKAALAIAIWRTLPNDADDPATWFLSINGEVVSSSDTKGQNRILRFEMEQWQHCLPISVEEYDRAVAEGRWSDEAPLIPIRRTMSNLDPDPIQAAIAQLADLEERARSLLKEGADPKVKLDAKEYADRAQNLRGLLKEVQNSTEKKRKVATEPLHAAWKTELARWSKPLEYAQQLSQELYVKVVKPWQVAEQAKLDAEFKAKQAATRAANAAALKTMAEEPWRRGPEEAPQHEEPEREYASVGAKGMKSSIKPKLDVVVTDKGELAKYLANLPNDEINEVAVKIARRIYNANPHAVVPGSRYEETLTTRG
jgi:hypothetical protein